MRDAVQQAQVKDCCILFALQQQLNDGCLTCRQLVKQTAFGQSMCLVHGLVQGCSRCGSCSTCIMQCSVMRLRQIASGVCQHARDLMHLVSLPA
jgi:hypothetical protein